jgi:hypothetical protein
MTGVYNPKAFILHAASLCQAFAHCKRSSTAASRRSLGSISVPMWLVVLSDQLTVSLGEPLPHQLADGARAHLQAPGSEESPASVRRSCEQQPHPVLAPVSRCYPQLRGRLPTCYSPFRHFCSYSIATIQTLVRRSLSQHKHLPCHTTSVSKCRDIM